jgi:hypothetical protein
VKGWTPKHLDIPDVPIHKANHILRILNSALPGRQLLRLMPGPQEHSGSLQSEYRSARLLYRSLLTAKHAGKACFLHKRESDVVVPVSLHDSLDTRGRCDSRRRRTPKPRRARPLVPELATGAPPRCLARSGWPPIRAFPSAVAAAFLNPNGIPSQSPGLPVLRSTAEGGRGTSYPG